MKIYEMDTTAGDVTLQNYSGRPSTGRGSLFEGTEAQRPVSCDNSYINDLVARWTTKVFGNNFRWVFFLAR
jgi:hypothetical protein